MYITTGDTEAPSLVERARKLAEKTGVPMCRAIKSLCPS